MFLHLAPLFQGLNFRSSITELKSMNNFMPFDIQG